MRDLYLGREAFMDPSTFSADRFNNDAALVREVHIIKHFQFCLPYPIS